MLPEAITVRRYQHENPTSGQLLRNDTRLDLSIEPDFYRGASLNSHCPTSKTFFQSLTKIDCDTKQLLTGIQLITVFVKKKKKKGESNDEIAVVKK